MPGNARHLAIELYFRSLTGEERAASDLHACCTDCGQPSSFTRAILIAVGDETVYGCPRSSCAGWLIRLKRNPHTSGIEPVGPAARLWAA